MSLQATKSVVLPDGNSYRNHAFSPSTRKFNNMSSVKQNVTYSQTANTLASFSNKSKFASHSQKLKTKIIIVAVCNFEFAVTSFQVASSWESSLFSAHQNTNVTPKFKTVKKQLNVPKGTFYFIRDI